MSLTYKEVMALCRLANEIKGQFTAGQKSYDLTVTQRYAHSGQGTESIHLNFTGACRVVEQRIHEFEHGLGLMRSVITDFKPNSGCQFYPIPDPDLKPYEGDPTALNSCGQLMAEEYIEDGAQERYHAAAISGNCLSGNYGYLRVQLYYSYLMEASKVNYGWAGALIRSSAKKMKDHVNKVYFG